MKTSMNKAHQRHRREQLDDVTDKESGLRIGRRKKPDYVPFRQWVRDNRGSFPGPSPKLAAILRKPS